MMSVAVRPVSGARGGCPIDHDALSQQKTARTAEGAAPAISRDAQGVWHVRGYNEAKAVLRNANTKQAGFKAELVDRMPGSMTPPILYQEGTPHHEQRKQTARYFTPKTVSDKYHDLMHTLSDDNVTQLQHTKRADLSDLSMLLAVRVAGQVVGLTDSLVPGLNRRLDAFFANDLEPRGWSPRSIISMVRNQARILQFFWLDVKPAINARRKHGREDVVSHLLARGATDAEILTECMTYAAAGMVTTREFICAAAWHLLEHPDLRQQFLAGDDTQRYQLLHEILRVEPVVGHLFRRATDDLIIHSNGAPVIIPNGALIDLHIHAANADEELVGEQPHAVCPARTLSDERAGAPVLSFGDGHHRCPGAYIAIAESDIFLRRLLAVDGLRMEQLPTLTWNDLVTGYELRNFVIVVD